MLYGGFLRVFGKVIFGVGQWVGWEGRWLMGGVGVFVFVWDRWVECRLG